MRPAYEVLDGTGPPILLVHGVLSSNRQWQPNLAALSKVGRPVLLELLGHGASPAPSDPEAYRPESYVEALEEIRRELRAESWYLVGYSLGARITFEYALRHPSRVLAHVVTNTLSGFSTPRWIQATKEVMSDILADVRQRGRPAIEAMPIHPKNSSRLDPEMRDGLCRDLANSDPLGIALTATETALSPPLTEAMSGNQVPTLLTCGCLEERFLPRRDWAAENLPHLTVLDLDAAHAVNVEAADAWNAAVVSFFREHPPAEPPA
jgi:2-succinyl-6-hydroxy-2,4-cyclohexadiene-1-carboxylate synthase